MKQHIFETRQQAEDLLKESIAIWKQSYQNTQLEGLENDPAFTLLLTALAYQLNDIDFDIARIKQDVLDEYGQLMKPTLLGHATPATAVIEATTQDKMPPITLNDRSVFTLEGTDFQFIPLLNTTVYGIEITSLVRLDARRWKMEISFNTPVTDINGLAFAIKSEGFKNLEIRINGKAAPLIKPWQYSGLPLCRCFSIGNMLYGHTPTSTSTLWFDLFARQNVRIFCLKNHKPNTYFTFEEDKLTLEFEFFGTTEDFVVDKDSFAFNPIVLVNATPRSVDLSADMPIARVENGSERNKNTEQFVQLLRPSDDQLYGNATVDVRTVDSDRYNQSSLLKTINSLLNKLNTDYYAFFNIKEKYKDGPLQQLRSVLNRLQQACNDSSGETSLTPGTYLMLRQNEIEANKELNLRVDYLTTNGAYVNNVLTPGSTFAMPTGITGSAAAQLIQDPVGGTNAINDPNSKNSLSRYNLITQDRIVTTADIRCFCYTLLQTQYSVPSEIIKQITIKHQVLEGRNNAGYAIWVDILIEGTPFVKRYFAEKTPQAELYIQKMIETRSCTLYPILVNIRIEEQS
jgi:hypothetical protein